MSRNPKNMTWLLTTLSVLCGIASIPVDGLPGFVLAVVAVAAGAGAWSLRLQYRKGGAR